MLSVIIGDLDHFKVIDETYGQRFGDVVLRKSARRFVGLMRDSMPRAGIGGEESSSLYQDQDAAKNPARSHQLVEVLAARPFEWKEIEIKVTCSFGVTVAQPWLDHTTIDDLIRRADKALSEAKRNSRNHVEIDPMFKAAELER